MHEFLGYSQAKRDKAKEKELERRNAKLEPLGTVEEDGSITLAFKWKDLRAISHTVS